MSEYRHLGVTALYYLTHRGNVAGILRHGILSRDRCDQLGILPVSIADPGVQHQRARTFLIDQGHRRNLHKYVPLYFSPRTPMLYYWKHLHQQIVILTVDPQVLDWPTTVVTDGNAATQGLDRGQSWVEIAVGRDSVVVQRIYHPATFTPRRKDVTHFYAGPGALAHVPWDQVGASDWPKTAKEKRQRQAEALVLDRVPPEYITGLHVRDHDLLLYLQQVMQGVRRVLPVRVMREWFSQ